MISESDRVAKQRLFFALWPSDALRDQVARAVEPLVEGKRARKVRPGNFHITLAFLGYVSPEGLHEIIDVGNATASAPFDLVLDHLESWRAAHVACLTIAPTPQPLANLVERLRFNLLGKNLEPDRKEFRAHVTLARDWRDKRLDERIGPFVWPVREFVLVESKPGRDGSEYRILQRWSLVREASE